MLRIVLPYATLLLALAVAFFRLQQVGLVNDATRAFNKRITNPAMMKLAGQGSITYLTLLPLVVMPKHSPMPMPPSMLPTWF